MTCLGDGAVNAERRTAAKRPISFAAELRVVEGTKADWPYFARWHYRSHHLGFVKKVVRLLHGEEPIAICVFASPAAALAMIGHASRPPASAARTRPSPAAEPPGRCREALRRRRRLTLPRGASMFRPPQTKRTNVKRRYDRVQRPGD